MSRYKYRYTNAPSVLQGDVPEDEQYSFVSGRHTHCDFHHIIGKNKYYKRLSEQYGFWIWLTPEEHDNLHHTAAGVAYSLTLKQQCQEVFEMEHSRKMFIRLFGKSYL